MMGIKCDKATAKTALKRGGAALLITVVANAAYVGSLLLLGWSLWETKTEDPNILPHEPLPGQNTTGLDHHLPCNVTTTPYVPTVTASTVGSFNAGLGTAALSFFGLVKAGAFVPAEREGYDELNAYDSQGMGT